MGLKISSFRTLHYGFKVIILNSMAMKTTNRGMEITDERVHNSQEAIKLVEEAKRIVGMTHTRFSDI